MFTCCATPYRLAFSRDKSIWEIVDTIIDCCFFIDVIANFFTPYYDSEYMLIDSKKVITFV